MAQTEWNELIGLRTAFLSLILRAIGAFIVWGLATLLLLWIGSHIPLVKWIVIFTSILTAVGPFLFGCTQSYRGLPPWFIC